MCFFIHRCFSIKIYYIFLDVTVGDFTFSKYDVAPEIRSIGWGLAGSTAAHLPGILDTPDLEGRSCVFVR